MRYVRYLSIIFLFALSSCAEEKEQGSSFYESQLIDKDISLEKVDEFVLHNGMDTDYTIGELRFTFATNAAGNLHAFYDEKKKSFIVANEEGEIQNVISQEGRGPAEIIKAGSFNFNKQNRLVVFDDRQRIIKVFNLDGDIINHAKPEESNYFITGRKLQIYNDQIVSATMDQRLLGNLKEEAYKSKLAAIHSYDGEFIDTVGRYDPSLREPKSYNVSSIINVDQENDRLLGTHSYNYRVQIYDLQNKKRLGWFGRKTQNFKEGEEYIPPQLPHDKIQEMSVGRSTAISIHPLSEYIMLYFETLTEAFFETNDFNDKEGYIAIYDKETFDSYGDIELPYILGNLANGQLYLIENDHPDNFTVGIYELND